MDLYTKTDSFKLLLIVILAALIFGIIFQVVQCITQMRTKKKASANQGASKKGLASAPQNQSKNPETLTKSKVSEALKSPSKTIDKAESPMKKSKIAPNEHKNPQK